MKNFRSKNIFRMLILASTILAVMTASVYSVNLYFGHSVSKAYKQISVKVMNHIPNSFWQQIWFTSALSSRLVWGYVNKHSVSPGESFQLMLSTDSKDPVVNGHIEIYRIGYYKSSDRKLYYTSPDVKVEQQLISPTASAVGLNWSAYFKIKTDITWKSGYYAIDFVNGSKIIDKNIAYIVVTPSIKTGDILVKLSTNTYEAYNQWGGGSLYGSYYKGRNGKTGSYYNNLKNNVVSFDRPTTSQFFRYEYYYVQWLEKLASEEGVDVDYATDFDVSADKAYTSNYKVFIAVGHDEYWSMDEFNNVYYRINTLGKNTLFLGANEAYWQVRYGDLNIPDGVAQKGRLMICYKDINDPIKYYTKNAVLKVTAKFREGGRYPETMLMGVGFQSYFNTGPRTKYPYYSKMDENDFPLLKNTGYRKGTNIGDVVGYEWDNSDPDEDGARLWDKEASKIHKIPANSLTVVFSGSPINFKGVKGKAEAVYFQSSAGAKVFSAGTIRWSWGVGKPGFEELGLKQFNKNLILDFLQKNN